MKSITEEEYKRAADILQCEVEVIKAVAEVESTGAGFNANGEVKILFEPHLFYRNLTKIGFKPLSIESLAKSNPDILYPVWKAGAYGKTSEQWNRLRRAITIDEEAALLSASYGKFQILGSNYGPCRYDNVYDFVDEMMIDENAHLRAFTKFIISNKMQQYLQKKDWAGFALRYNGKSYKVNKYDTKMQAAYNVLKRNN